LEGVGSRTTVDVAQTEKARAINNTQATDMPYNNDSSRRGRQCAALRTYIHEHLADRKHRLFVDISPEWCSAACPGVT